MLEFRAAQRPSKRLSYQCQKGGHGTGLKKKKKTTLKLFVALNVELHQLISEQNVT